MENPNNANVRQNLIKVYNNLGYGFLEKVYENAMCIECQNIGLKVENQVPIKVHFKGKFYCTFREGEGHTPVKSGVDGSIRVISSVDGTEWQFRNLSCFRVKKKGRYAPSQRVIT